MYDPLVLLLVISETQPSQIFAFDPFVKESYLINKLNHEDSEPDLLNARVKSDIAIYSNEDLPKEAECIRVYCRLYTNAIQAMQFRTPPISFLYQQNRLPNHSLKPKPHYRHGEIRSPRKEWLPKFFQCLSHTFIVFTIHATFTRIQDDRKLARPLGLNLSKVGAGDDLNHKTTFYIVSKRFANKYVFLVSRGMQCFKFFNRQRGKIISLTHGTQVASEQTKSLQHY